MRQPDFYAEREGGKLIPWPADLDVNILDLNSYPKGIKSIAINTMPEGLEIHSIRWHLAGELYARWDTINHWTD